MMYLTFESQELRKHLQPTVSTLISYVDCEVSNVSNKVSGHNFGQQIFIYSCVSYICHLYITKPLMLMYMHK